ncbi:MAG: hypothetical protein KJ941_04075 [Bacteroidetes bacterium]|nr:hypothetical protein [Bacteroidota bacterium]
MNQMTNVTLLFLTIPILMFCIYVGYDLPLDFLKTTGAQLPYIIMIQWCLGLLVFLILMRRSAKRWFGMRLLRQTKRFVSIQDIAPIRRKRAVLYTLLEAFILLYVCLGIHSIFPFGTPIYLAYGLGFVDSIVFAFIGTKGKGWKIGITKKAIVLADREVSVVYFHGLRKVHMSHETIYFDYVGELQLSLPLAAVEDAKDFVNSFLPFVDREKVFLDESVKGIL